MTAVQHFASSDMEFSCETHISTKRSGTQKAARIPFAQRNQERHESSRTAPLEGP
jgi:hypothetical protein